MEIFCLIDDFCKHFDTGLRELQNFAKKWDEKYPVIFDIWQRNWSGIVPFFSFPEDIRKAIYT
ncbi:MAG: transposase, partial [Candidatus Tisiphia sp.]